MLSHTLKLKRRAAVIAVLALLSFLACLAGVGLAPWMREAACDPRLDLEPLAVRLRQSVLPHATGPFISETLRSKVADPAASVALQQVLERTIPNCPDILAAAIVSPDGRILAAFPGREKLVGRGLNSNRSAFLAPPMGAAGTPDSPVVYPGMYPGPPGGAPAYSSSGSPYGSGGPPGYSSAPFGPVASAGGSGSGGPPASPPDADIAGGPPGPPGGPLGHFGGPPSSAPGPGSPADSGPLRGAVPFPIPTDPGSRLRALFNQVQPGHWPAEFLTTPIMVSQWLFVLHREGVYQLTVLPRPNLPAYAFSTYYLAPSSRVGALLSFAVYWLMLPWWVYLDARWRTGKAMPLALFVLLTNFLGWLTYLVIRPEGNQMCPICVSLLEPSFRICPHCGWSRAVRCRQCGRALRSGWRFCPYCEAPRTDAAPVENSLQ